MKAKAFFGRYASGAGFIRNATHVREVWRSMGMERGWRHDATPGYDVWMHWNGHRITTDPEDWLKTVNTKPNVLGGVPMSKKATTNRLQRQLNNWRALYQGQRGIIDDLRAQNAALRENNLALAADNIALEDALRDAHEEVMALVARLKAETM